MPQVTYTLNGGALDYREYGAVQSYSTWRLHTAGTASINLRTLRDASGNNMLTRSRLVRIGLRRQSDGTQVRVAEWANGASGVRSFSLPSGYYAVNFRWEASTSPPFSSYAYFNAVLTLFQ